MEKFALIGMQDTVHRYIDDHPFLKILPKKIAMGMVSKTKPRLTHTICGQYSGKELGYIMDVPGFFVQHKRRAESKRIKLIYNIIDILIQNNIKIMVFPLWRKFINIEEKRYMEENSIVLLDGDLMRLVSSMMTIERIFKIPNIKPHTIDLGIWGADTDIGQAWAELLAPHLNYMTLGGKNAAALDNLSKRILYKTGLSCSITEDPKQCLNNKTLVILGDDSEEMEGLLNSKIAVFWGALSNKPIGIRNPNMGSIFMESGWIPFPNEFKMINDFSPWDHMGILEAIIFILEGSYAYLLQDGEMNREKVKKTKDILKKYDIINSSGFISNNELLSYNGFRRLYFTNNLDKSNIGNYN